MRAQHILVVNTDSRNHESLLCITHSHKETKMKKILNTIYEVMESIGRAKAAAHLSRMGLHDEAKALMLAD
jgi:hypothetical protein